MTEFDALLARYAAAEFARKSAVSLPDGAEIIREAIAGHKRVLEIGTYRGVTSAFMSQFCERVITVDLAFGKMEWDHQVFDRVRFWEAMGRHNIDLHLVRSNAEKAEVIRAQEFDFAFVDGNHDAPGPQFDFEMVRDCGNVLFHDYGADNGVTAFVNTLPGREVTVSGIFAMWRKPQ